MDEKKPKDHWTSRLAFLKFLKVGTSRTPIDSLLNSGEVIVRRNAVKELAESKDAATIEALCQALKDEDGYVRYLAARTLWQNADAKAIGSLVRVAQDDKASVYVQTLLRQLVYRCAESATTEDLRLAARLNDSYVLIFAQVDTHCHFTTFNVIRDEADFSQIKQLARQELIRRGLEA